MGGTTSKQEVKAKTNEQITENSSGTHLIEIHANSMGIGMFTILMFLAVMYAIHVAYKKCVTPATDDHDEGRRRVNRQPRRRRSNSFSYEERDEDFGYRRSHRRDRPHDIHHMDLSRAQVETLRSLMQPQHAIPFPPHQRHFEEVDMDLPTQIAQVHRTRIDPPALTARTSSRPVIGAIRSEVASPPAE